MIYILASLQTTNNILWWPCWKNPKWPPLYLLFAGLWREDSALIKRHVIWKKIYYQWVCFRLRGTSLSLLSMPAHMMNPLLGNHLGWRVFSRQNTHVSLGLLPRGTHYLVPPGGGRPAPKRGHCVLNGLHVPYLLHVLLCHGHRHGEVLGLRFSLWSHILGCVGTPLAHVIGFLA